MRSRLILVFTLSSAVCFCTVVNSQTAGPENGSLILVGGGQVDDSIYQRFIELAGGPESLIVIIPTAGTRDEFGVEWTGLKPFKSSGALNLVVLHTRDRDEAESIEFNSPLTRAGGVWITGGRQWRLVDSYLNTRVHRELNNLLIRGGVIAGSSAGATIQGSFLVRGDTNGNELMMGDHQEGMAFLKNSAVDQHLLRRNRQFDLIPVIEKHPHLLGIGLDEGTAILVQQNQCRILGKTYVAFYDHDKMKNTGAPFELLATGQEYDLLKRQRISAGHR